MIDYLKEFKQLLRSGINPDNIGAESSFYIKFVVPLFL